MNEMIIESYNESYKSGYKDALERVKTEADELCWYGRHEFWDGVNAVLGIVENAHREVGGDSV